MNTDKEVLRLIEIHFDDLENNKSDGIIKKTIGIFDESNGLTAHGKIVKWFSEQPKTQLYLCWDGEVYPQYRIEKVNVF